MQGEACACTQYQQPQIRILDLAAANGANHTYTANVTAMSQIDEFQVTAPRISQPGLGDFCLGATQVRLWEFDPEPEKNSYTVNNSVIYA